MDQNPHFDEQGGSNSLPRTLSIMKFTAARIDEIKAMKNALQLSSATKLAFQTLPKHMRRRVMSHNPKRVPKDMRKKHINQMSKSGLPPSQKRPSRKHRRRPRNLQNEYARRQRKITWMETHIWHAKRFHIINRWGYRLPDRRCDKTFRASYRAVAKHCLLQDISYFSCISIKGPLDYLLEKLKNVCDSSIGLTFAAKAFLNGTREGQTTLFYNNLVPKKAIGTVFFMWNPPNEQNIRNLWIWIHAAFYKDALQTLIECLSLNFNSASNFYLNSDTKISLEELKFDFSRFRLTGPLSTAVLQKTLKIAHLSINTETDWEDNFMENPNFEEDMAVTHTSNKEVTEHTKNSLVENSKWFKVILEDANSKNILDEQQSYWKSLETTSSPDEVPPHTILSLIVSDPRYSYPKKREKALPTIIDNAPSVPFDIPENANKSWLWSKDIRNYVCKSKISVKIINDMRSDLLVPGSDLHHSGAPVPVLLIQRPGRFHENYGYGSGWDLIVPTGWGQPFWIAMVMRGAKSGGLREFNSILFESDHQQFLPPDTNAGFEEETRLSTYYRQKHFSRPPNKRPNYRKLSIAFPFNFPWKNLIQNWISSENNIDGDFHVLRSRKILQSLQDYLEYKKLNNNSVNVDSNCLVPIRIKMCGKGAPQLFATICLPQQQDLLKLVDPLEPSKEDSNYQERKLTKQSHKKYLKREKKQSKLSEKIRGVSQSKGKPYDASYNKVIERLWLPDPTNDVRFSSSREVVGFVSKGQFSFTHARNCAIGYVALPSFPNIVSCNGKVLVRNTNTLQYRFGEVKVIV